MFTPEDFERGPFLAKCKCGELAEIYAIEWWDKNLIRWTDYYIRCLNCGRHGFLATESGCANEERFAKVWTAFVEAEERHLKKKK